MDGSFRFSELKHTEYSNKKFIELINSALDIIKFWINHDIVQRKLNLN